MINLNNNIQKIIEDITEALSELVSYKESFKGLREYTTISVMEFSLKILLHFLNWVEKTLNAKSGSELEINSAKAQISLLKSSLKGISRVKFEEQIIALLDKYSSINTIEQLEDLIHEFILIPVPVYYSKVKERNYFGGLFVSEKNNDSEPSDEEDIDPNIIKLEIFFENSPWGNLQTLRPEITYHIDIKVEIPNWPVGFESLEIFHSTTFSSNLLEFGKANISKNENQPQIYNSKTAIYFKAPQNPNDPPIDLKLVANFISKDGKIKNATIIGYHKIKIKVSSKENYLINSGFPGLDDIGNEIIQKFENELPNLNPKELKDFSILLSGVLNYQGTCLNQGFYKNQNDVSEDTFRDNMIQHLQSNPLIGQEIVKESYVAGGRVEISFRGIIAELKVEKKVQSTKKNFEKYQKQPVCYTSGLLKQLGILCILNLTKKANPQANAKNEIEILTPDLHGHDKENCKYPTKIVGIIIQGNLINPSDYSK